MRRIRFLGHPVHPPLVHLPFGSLAAAPILLGIGWLGGGDGWRFAARCALDVGLVSSIPAIGTGLLELASIRTGHPAWGAAFVHLSAMGAALTAYAAARWTWDRPVVSDVLVLLGLLGLVIGGAAGGHLVYVDQIAAPED